MLQGPWTRRSVAFRIDANARAALADHPLLGRLEAGPQRRERVRRRLHDAADLRLPVFGGLADW